jgi:DNA (cytosine-5)-methyltransferase 1
MKLSQIFLKPTRKNHSEFDNGKNLILGDITLPEIRKKIIAATKHVKTGIVVGGPPCQGFSHAGWRNPDDNRNQLFKEFVHIVDQVQPEMFVMENVREFSL